jgi:hypothetical protein
MCWACTYCCESYVQVTYMHVNVSLMYGVSLKKTSLIPFVYENMTGNLFGAIELNEREVKT